MILDTLQNAQRYHCLGAKFVTAFNYLVNTDFTTLKGGKYEIEGTDIFAIVNEYDTISADEGKVEAHKKYIDIQYVVQGEEQVGHDFLEQQIPSQAYDADTDVMFFSDKPSFFTKLLQGHFAVFFPTDLHMPNIKIEEPVPVKKIVIKISV